MNRTLAILNFVGILLLTGLCVLQWQANRRLNLSHIALEQQCDQQATKIAQQQTTIQGATADLNDFRVRLVAANDALVQGQTKLQSLTAQHQLVTAERDRLQAANHAMETANQAMKTTLDKWIAAVAARDEALKNAEAQIQSLAEARNDAIAKFNDLAKKYNASVGEIKKANDVIQQLSKDRADVVAKYNDLATKYNALAQPKAPSTSP